MIYRIDEINRKSCDVHSTPELLPDLIKNALRKLIDQALKNEINILKLGFVLCMKVVHKLSYIQLSKLISF